MRVFLVCLSLLAFNFSPSPAIASTSEVAEAHTSGSWCVTPRHIFNISDIGLKKSVKESYCGRDGKIFHSRSAASAEYKRLTGSSYTGYSYSDNIWCVEKWDYTYMPYGQCVARGGEVFSSEDQAEAENKRRKQAEYKRIAESSDWKYAWCASKWQVVWKAKDACTYMGGKAYSTEDQARAALQRSRSAKSAFKSLASPAVASAPGSKVWCLRHYQADTMSVDRMSQLSCDYIGGTAYLSFDEANSELNRLTTISNRTPEYDPGWSSNSYWCATRNRVWETTGWACRYSNKAEYFKTRAEAEAEYLSLRSEKDRVDQRRENTAYCFDEDSDKYYFGPYRDPWNARCSPGDLEVSLHEYIQETSVPALTVELVWCATNITVSHIYNLDCDAINGTAFSESAYDRALAEHERISRVPDPLVWCATAFTVKRIYESECRSKQGKTYPARAAANSPPREAFWGHLRLKAEHKQLEDASSTAYKMSDNAKSLYLSGIGVKRFHNGGGGHVALAVSSDNYWFSRWGGTIISAQQGAFMRCKSETKNACKLMDVDGESPFIDKVWCVHSGVVATTIRNLCDTWDGTAYATKLLAEQNRSSKSSEAVSHLVWCGEVKPSVGIRWVWRNTRTSCIESGGTVIAADDETKVQAKEAYDSMLAGLNDPYVHCGYSHGIVTEKRSVCEANDGFHTTGNLTWCGKSFKRRCSEKTESVALQPQTGWCASPWQVRYTSRKNCRRPGEELWSTKSGAQTALRKKYYQGRNVVGWCATAESFKKSRVNDCESIDGNFWSTEALAKSEHDRLKSASSTELAQISEKIWCATVWDVWETDKGSCRHRGGRDFTNQHLAENESIRRFEAQKEIERKQREREAIAEKKRQELEAITKREQNLKKLLATKSCRECDLRGVDLRKANLNGAILVKANLQGASLVMASLEGSNLTGANLREVDLTGANLAKATLRKADLSQAHVTPRFLNLFPTNLSWADLSEAKLVGANLAGVNFTGAVLTQADLTRANLMNVDLDDADLSGAILIETSLIEANLDHADLTDANLSRANLTDACLDRTNLSRANLSNTFLSKATFRKANLNQVNLQKSRLSNADLSGVDLRGADLSGANLTRANLRGTGLEGAQLHGANLYEADLTGADLSRADLEGVNLIRAWLRIADLRWSNLSGAELDGAKLVGANLTGANLTRASLNRSDLSRANLTKADLSGADLNRADLSRTALIQAILVGADLYRATLDKADLSQADLTNADLTGVSSQEVIWDQVVLCGTMMQSRVIDDSGCKPDRKNTEPINHRS